MPREVTRVLTSNSTCVIIRYMITYEVRQVERDEKGNSINIIYDKCFLSLKQVAKFRDLLLKEGCTPEEIDIVVSEGPRDDRFANYRMTLDSLTLKDKGY